MGNSIVEAQLTLEEETDKNIQFWISTLEDKSNKSKYLTFYEGFDTVTQPRYINL